MSVPRFRVAPLLLGCLLLGLYGSLVGCSGRPEFEAGQVWAYKHRPGEAESRLYIVRVDEDETYGRIYHCFVDGLAVRHPNVVGGVQKFLPHLPVTARSLDESVTELLESGVGYLPDISSSYEAWKAGYLDGEAGVFDKPIADIVQSIEDLVNT